MTQLVYQPAFDPYNAAFRLLRLRDGVTLSRPLAFEGVRILDFFMLFPFLIGEVKLRQKDRNFRSLAKKYVNLRPYARMPDSNQLLARMKPFQVAAANRLASNGLIDLDLWKAGLFAATSFSLPKELQAEVSNANEAQVDLLKMLTEFANGYQLTGPDGLKARSELLEFRYDTV